MHVYIHHTYKHIHFRVTLPKGESQDVWTLHTKSRERWPMTQRTDMSFLCAMRSGEKLYVGMGASVHINTRTSKDTHEGMHSGVYARKRELIRFA